MQIDVSMTLPKRSTSSRSWPAEFERPHGCATYVACFAALAESEADTHLHVDKENNVLFPLVVQLELLRAAAAAP